MSSDWRRQVEAVVAPAVARSTSIDAIEIASGALASAPRLFAQHLGNGPAFLIADDNTWAAAGAATAAALAASGRQTHRHVLRATPQPKPTLELATDLARRIALTDAVPVAIGSGVINDLVKHAAFALDRPFMCIATAASMDGYASGGAPLSQAGFKKTIACAPARVVIGDLDVIGAAPEALSARGYGDLAGKMPAGADWIVADRLGIEPRDDVAWPLVHDHLRDWLAAPEAVARGEDAAIAALFTGLTISGLAMEFHGTSRPASGADHQIAHLWEMEDLVIAGERVAHGACVAVGCQTTLALYDWLLAQDLTTLDVEAIVASSPSLDDKRRDMQRLLASAVAARAIDETAAKHLDRPALRSRLERVRAAWPSLRRELRGHLIPAYDMARWLRAAGAPVGAHELGVDAARHRATIAAARFIRTRYTILDLLDECGLLDTALEAVFATPAFGRPTE